MHGCYGARGQGARTPDVAGHKGREGVGDEEHSHDGPPLREQRACAHAQQADE